MSAPVDETWHAVPFAPGYEVTQTGAIRSVDRLVTTSAGHVRRYRGQTITEHIGSDGYPRVSLGHAHRKVKVAVVVLRTFVGDCPEGHESLHRDGDATNSALTNLHWGTHADNCRDIVRHGTHGNSRKIVCPLGHRLVEPNLTPGDLARRGRRRCRSCQYADTWMREHDTKLTKAQVADRRYAELMEAA